MSLTREKDVWEPISVQHYGQSLRLLTDELWAEGANRDITLTATILLCSHDVLAFPDADYQRLLYGGRTLIEADFDAIDTNDLSRASFWIYARQDVSLALENERPTLIPPKEWPAVPSPEETQEDALARRMLWLLARVIEVRFDGRSDADGKEQDELIFDLTSELFDWSMSIPGHANGVEVEDDLDLADDLEQTWFCVPSSDPLFYAAKHCASLSLKARIWALLEDIERRLGIHTLNRVSRLQSQWVSTAEAAA
ncbi:hypothetical protein CEP52_008666 [Fusarium oligoseptatum]|uniref:Uncharacterized protein n=1 Tax=Fusarium oligoseptatum TaxID=2604345 RepID=A0A428TGK3_9HYPO|nr:hypothetical protein CEP52_008666 [Fusarium oligoseptatum]